MAVFPRVAGLAGAAVTHPRGADAVPVLPAHAGGGNSVSTDGHHDATFNFG